VGHNLLQRHWRIDNEFQVFIDNFLYENFYGHIVIAIQLRYAYIKWKDTDAFIDCAINIEKQINKTNIKWFVTSDNNKNLKRIEAKYKNKVIHTLDFIQANRVNSMYGKYGSTILDNELMSKSDFLIISGGSTFGFTAAIRKNELPFYVNGGRNQKKCIKMTLSELSITNSGFAVF
jgi:hypothetical protein